MLDYEQQRKLITIFILASILVIILTIVALIFIWLPNNEEENNEFRVGIIENSSYSEETVIEGYYKQLYVLFMSRDIDKIYDKLSEDYIEYTKMTKEKLNNLLNEKGVFNGPLELVKYTNYWISNYSNVYSVDLKVKNEAYAINIVLKEKSPEDYTISFDSFIDYNEDVQKASLNSIELDILKRTRFTNSIQYEFTLHNKYNKQVTVNKGSSGNPLILVSSSGKTKRPIVSTISAADVILGINEKKAITVAYKIESEDDYMFFNTLVLKNVGYEGIDGTENLEFKLN